MTIALKTVNYLDKEKEFIPWKASLRELGYVDSMLERTALYGPFSVSYIYRMHCKIVFNFALRHDLAL